MTSPRYKSILCRLLPLYLVLGASCNDSRQPDIPHPNAAVLALNTQIDSLSRIDDDSVRASAIRSVYLSAEPADREAIFDRIYKATSRMLVMNIGPEFGLLPFYRVLANDEALSLKHQIKAAIQLGNFYAHVAHDADSAMYYLAPAIQHADVLDDTMNAKRHSVAAQVNQLRGQPKEAATNLYNATALYEKIGDSAALAAANGNLANVYRAMNDLEKSIAVRKNVLQYFIRTNNDPAQVVAAQGLVADYVNLNKFDSVRKYAAFAEELFENGVQNIIVEYYLYLSEAAMYVSLSKQDSAILYFDKAKNVLELIGDETQKVIFTMTSAIAYSQKRSVRPEAELIQEYIPKFLAEDNLELAKDAYYCLYNISLKQKLNLTPLDYYQLYDSLQRVLSDQENREFVAEMESKYESQKKTIKIQAQQKELQQRKTQNLVLILSSLMLLVTGGFLFARFQLLRSRKEARLQEHFTRNLLKNTEDERRRIAGELHDGVGHELLLLKNSLQQGVNRTEARIDHIINDVRMISRNLHPVVLDQIGLKHSIQYLCDQLMEGGGLFVSAEIDYEGQLSRNDELQLYRIIQESLNNVIKYAGAMAAKIDIHPKKDKLCVSIMDNGKGFDVEETMNTERAFGLNSMVQRAKALGGRINISSTPEGTVINLEIPIDNAIHHNS